MEETKKKFEVKIRKNSDGTLERAIFIDGEVLDWTVDLSSFMEAVKMGPKFKKAAQEDIAKHFIDSVSEVLYRRVTMDEIKTAIQTGWI